MYQNSNREASFHPFSKNKDWPIQAGKMYKSFDPFSMSKTFKKDNTKLRFNADGMNLEKL